MQIGRAVYFISWVLGEFAIHPFGFFFFFIIIIIISNIPGGKKELTQNTVSDTSAGDGSACGCLLLLSPPGVRSNFPLGQTRLSRTLHFRTDEMGTSKSILHVHTGRDGKT